MKPGLSRLLSDLRHAPLIASVQASDPSAVDDPTTLSHLAQASLDQGVRWLRLQGVANIRAIRAATHAPVIGLIKRRYEASEVYISPTLAEVQALLDLGCEVIALDGTSRARPGGETLAQLTAAIHAGGALAMADCDTLESALGAVAAGVDMVGTTLSGYTDASTGRGAGPDFDFLRAAVNQVGVPVIAEGRYGAPWEAQAARRIGAAGLVVGGALNDPVKQTRAFLAATTGAAEPVLAVDIGGTWLRAARGEADGSLGAVVRTALPADRATRLAWICDQARAAGVRAVGISTGGTVDPVSGIVTESKPIIPDHLGTDFRAGLPGLRVAVLNDGLATAWGHACRPEYAGRRVATLALGTGVGCGLVDRGRLIIGPGGGYPRLNDLPAPGGEVYESLLGGAALTPDPNANQRAAAQRAADVALRVIHALWMPDVVVVAGGVGLAPWLRLDAERTPFGPDAGLYGALALALNPPLGG